MLYIMLTHIFHLNRTVGKRGTHGARFATIHLKWDIKRALTHFIS